MIELIIGGAVVVLVAGAAYAYSRWVETQEIIKTLMSILEKTANQKTHQAKTYELPKQDEQLVYSLKEMLDNKFPAGIEGAIKSMTFEQRKATTLDIAQKAAEIMKIGPIEVVFDTNTENSGSFIPGTNIINISELCLLKDDTAPNVLNTIFHELRHMLQEKSVENNFMGYDQRVIDEWSTGIQNYISHSVSPKLYYYQMIEIDARRFAEKIYKYNN